MYPSVGHSQTSLRVSTPTFTLCFAHDSSFPPSPHARHVVVHLVALQATAVSAAQKALSQSAGSMTPQAFALAVHDLQPQWPDDGTLVLQLNAGQPGEQSWFASDMVCCPSFIWLAGSQTDPPTVGWKVTGCIRCYSYGHKFSPYFTAAKYGGVCIRVIRYTTHLGDAGRRN